MITNDKTGEKRVASIRRSNTGVAEAGVAESGAKPAPRRRTASASPPAETALVVPQTPSPRDRYQSARRVWPD